MAQEWFDGLVQIVGPPDANAPEVDAGDDMITWSGQPVLLDPNIVEKEPTDWTDLTYAWSADPNDDACLAAIGEGLAANNPTDFDGNCITDANDLAELATKWLNDTGLTGPVAK